MAYEKSLRKDALEIGENRYSRRGWGGIRRLLFYYPDAGREVVEQLLARRTAVPTGGADTLEPGEISCHIHTELVAQLAPVTWDRLEQKIFALYRRAIALEVITIRGRFYRNELALGCAQRLLSEDYAEVMRDFFLKELALNEAELASPGQGMRHALFEQNKNFKTLLGRIDTLHPKLNNRG